MEDAVLLETKGAVGVVTLNRPDRLNVLNSEMFEGLRFAFARIEADPDIRVVLLTGSGRGFCAGADLGPSLSATAPLDLGKIVEQEYNPLVRWMRDLPKPILAAVNGVAAGAGMNLALAADIVIAARSAKFTQAFIRIGLVPDAGGTYFLPRLIGAGNARAMAMLGETLEAAQVERLGLVWQVFEDSEFAAAAMQMAQSLAAKPAGALAAIKQALLASPGSTLDAQLELERGLQQQLGYTADFAEGVKAFAEKRPAVFNNRRRPINR